VIVWLTAVLAATAVMFSRPRQPWQRLTPADQGGAAPSSSRVTARGWLLAALAGSAMIALHLPIVLAAVAGVVPPAVMWLRERRRSAARRVARETAVVEVTFALAAELRAGRTTREALAATAETAGPLRSVLAAAAASVDVGGSASAELEAGADLPGAERLRTIAATWRVTEAAGGRVALVLERLGEAMDREDALRREMQAAMAAPQATMMMLAALPLVGLGLGEAIGANPLHLLIYKPLGWGLLAGAAIFDTAGILISKRIAKRALR
jgi:tight adherence protein B